MECLKDEYGHWSRRSIIILLSVLCLSFFLVYESPYYRNDATLEEQKKPTTLEGSVPNVVEEIPDGIDDTLEEDFVSFHGKSTYVRLTMSIPKTGTHHPPL